MRENTITFDERMIEAEEDLVIDAQFLIQRLMNEHGLTRAEVARRAGISKARLTQLLRPEANPTLRTIARIVYAIGERVHLGCGAGHGVQTEGAPAKAHWSGSAGGPAADFGSVVYLKDLFRNVHTLADRKSVQFGYSDVSNDVGGPDSVGSPVEVAA